MKKLLDRQYHNRSSGSTTEEDFNSFSRQRKRELNKFCKQKLFTLTFNKGHYYLSGFVSNGDKHIYWNISDVRHFNNDWINNILIRTAEHTKDYTGGMNQKVTLEKFKDKILYMLTK